jgi:hypothetical protein
MGSDAGDGAATEEVGHDRVCILDGNAGSEATPSVTRGRRSSAHAHDLATAPLSARAGPRRAMGAR